MNNEGFLAEDFQQIKTKSDDAVFELLKKGENKQPFEEPKPTQAVEKPKNVLNKKPSRKPNRNSRKSPETVPPNQFDANDWGKPVVLFNTRIPEKLSWLLDDFVYQSKKEGKPVTKQSVAIDALTGFLKEHGLP